MKPPSVQRSIIGLLVPDIRTPDGTLVTRHMQDVCNAAHLEVLVSSTDNDRERFDQIIARHIKAPSVDWRSCRRRVESCRWKLWPPWKRAGFLVSYARSLDVTNWPTVQTDVYRAAYIAIEHLCGLGRRRIAFLSYPSPIASQMRLGVYRAWPRPV